MTPSQITILIPVYNREQYFRLFAKFFLRSHSLSETAYFIIDDRSEEFDIKVLAHEVGFPSAAVVKNDCHLGINDAFIHLVELAKDVGRPYLVLVDPDSLLTPDWLEFLCRYFPMLDSRPRDLLLSCFARLERSDSSFYVDGRTFQDNPDWPISNGCLARIESQEMIAERCGSLADHDGGFYSWEKSMTALCAEMRLRYVEPIGEGCLYHYGKWSSGRFEHRFLSSQSTGRVSGGFAAAALSEIGANELHALHLAEQHDPPHSLARPYHTK